MFCKYSPTGWCILLFWVQTIECTALAWCLGQCSVRTFREPEKVHHSLGNCMCFSGFAIKDVLCVPCFHCCGHSATYPLSFAALRYGRCTATFPLLFTAVWQRKAANPHSGLLTTKFQTCESCWISKIQQCPHFFLKWINEAVLPATENSQSCAKTNFLQMCSMRPAHPAPMGIREGVIYTDLCPKSQCLGGIAKRKDHFYYHRSVTVQLLQWVPSGSSP